MSLNMCFIGRNRIFLNGFLVEQEMTGDFKQLEKLELPLLEKIWDLCGGKQSQPNTNEHQIHRVDILFRVKEAEEAPLKFKMDNINDQFMSCDYENMYINQNYLRLFSYQHPVYSKIFEDK